MLRGEVADIMYGSVSGNSTSLYSRVEEGKFSTSKNCGSAPIADSLRKGSSNFYEHTSLDGGLLLSKRQSLTLDMSTNALRGVRLP